MHQDGLVHISAMTNRFISDPHTVVKAGDIITVKVIEVDKARKRIGLTMKLNEESSSAVEPKKIIRPVASGKKAPVKKPDNSKKGLVTKKAEPVKKSVFNTAMADALAKLKRGG